MCSQNDDPSQHGSDDKLRAALDEAVRLALHDYWRARYGESYDHGRTDTDAVDLVALIRARLSSKEPTE